MTLASWFLMCQGKHTQQQTDTPGVCRGDDRGKRRGRGGGETKEIREKTRREEAAGPF